MASYSVASTKHATLVAATVDTVTLAGNKRGFRIQHRTPGAPDIWYTWGYTSAVDPATDGSVDGSINLAAGGVDTSPPGTVDRENEAQIVVKVVSTGTPAYSVESW